MNMGEHSRIMYEGLIGQVKNSDKEKVHIRLFFSSCDYLMLFFCFRSFPALSLSLSLGPE